MISMRNDAAGDTPTIGWKRREWLAAMGAVLLPAGAAWAQGYPDRPVRIIVPYSPGGSLDVAMRIVAQQLSAQSGHTFLVENRTGAAGMIGIAAALDAPPDGYTLLAAGPNLTTTPYLSKAAKFEPIDSFTHIARLVLDASTLVVPAASPFRTLKDMVTYAKANPGRLNCGSSGAGTPGHMAMELLKRRAGIDVQHIPYRGGGIAINDALGGQLDMLLIGSSVVAPHIRSGKLRGLGTTSPQRFFTLPDVPAIAEEYPGYEASTWIGVSARAGLPVATVRYLEREIQTAMARPEVVERYRDAGLQAAYMGHAEFTQFATRDAAEMRKLVTEANITAE